jgi:hypothetical protein
MKPFNPAVVPGKTEKGQGVRALHQDSKEEHETMKFRF